MRQESVRVSVQEVSATNPEKNVSFPIEGMVCKKSLKIIKLELEALFRELNSWTKHIRSVFLASDLPYKPPIMHCNKSQTTKAQKWSNIARTAVQ
jgi:hypothetical protein